MHKGPRLLDFIGPKAAEKTMHWLKSRQVDVKLEQSVKLKPCKDGRRVYQTSLGETIVADCNFVCTARSSGSDWLADTELRNDLDFLGKLKVDEYLRVNGRENVFAVGDITNVPVSSLHCHVFQIFVIIQFYA